MVNFELKLDRVNLLLGVNGCGKSSVFDALRNVQDFVIEQEPVSTIFRSREQTRWLQKDIQTFELDIFLDGNLYRYKLGIRHEEEPGTTQVIKEELTVNDNPLFIYNDGMARLYRDDHTKGTEYPFTMTYSGVGFLDERKDNKLLTQFKRELGRLIVVRPAPMLMEQQSSGEDRRIKKMMENFPSWYRYISQTEGELGTQLFPALNEVLPGFRSLSFDSYGEGTKVLKANFAAPGGGKFSLNFSRELSDGQKMLIALYTLLIFSRSQEQRFSLLIDEPDNFLALGAIQPWLDQLADDAGRSIEQVALISHHPEVINYLGNAHGYWFDWDETYCTRIAGTPKRAVDGLTLAETVARGWEE